MLTSAAGLTTTAATPSPEHAIHTRAPLGKALAHRNRGKTALRGERIARSMPKVLVLRSRMAPAIQSESAAA